MQKINEKNVNSYHAKKFHEAKKLQQTGRLKEAEKIYKKILHDIPNNPDCIHFLGLLFFQKGDLKKAESNFKKSIQLANNPTYLCNYALFANHNKNYQTAISLLKKSIKLKPDFSDAWFNLGCIYNEIGELEDSENAYQQVIKHNNNHIKALFNLANVQEALNKTNESKSTKEKLMSLQPNTAEQYYSLAIAISRLNIENSTNLAIDYLRKAISINPKSIEVQRALATLHVEGNSIEKAISIYENIISIEPNIQDLNLDYANCLVKTANTNKAKKIFNIILDKDRNNLGALVGVANIYRLNGDFIKAEEIYKEIIKKDKNNIDAYSGLSNCKKFSIEDADFINYLDELLINKPHSTGYFSLGKIYDDLKNYDKAIDCYRIANKLKSKKINFDIEAYKKNISSVINIFDKSCINHLQTYGNPTEQPIFILGAPRSGTTLLEQIISSHSNVFGAGELPYIKNITLAIYDNDNKMHSYPDRFKNIKNKEVAFVKYDAENYLSKTKTFLNNDRILRVTDKMPGNFKYLGYIFSMFPNARIINTRRNPLDTCLSIYFQNFHSGHNYAFDFTNLIAWYKEYLRLMNHWQLLFSDNILTVDYDDVVTDTENTIRNVISYCGLEWDKKCLAFYASNRAVNTASNWQVKQPIFKSSSQKWKNYEKYITELINGLSDLQET